MGRLQDFVTVLGVGAITSGRRFGEGHLRGSMTAFKSLKGSLRTEGFSPVLWGS